MTTDWRAGVEDTAGEDGEGPHAAGLQGQTGAHWATVQPENSESWLNVGHRLWVLRNVFGRPLQVTVCPVLCYCVQSVPEMTYNVFSGTLNPTHLRYCCPVCLQRWCIVVKRLDGSRCYLVRRRIRGKIITAVLYDSCTQWRSHTYEQFLNMSVGLGFGIVSCAFV